MRGVSVAADLLSQAAGVTLPEPPLDFVVEPLNHQFDLFQLEFQEGDILVVARDLGRREIHGAHEKPSRGTSLLAGGA